MNPPMDAPIDMVVNPLWQWIFGVLHFGVAGLTIYLVLRNPMRHRDWWKVLFRTVILCSGALGAVVIEGAVDRAGKLWYAEHGAWPLVQFWGTHVPLWVSPVYLWFISTNRLFDLVPALLILLLMSFRTKWVIAAIPFVMFGSMYVSYAFVTWPTVSALHSGASPLIAGLAATYTIVFGVAATFAGAHLGPRMTNIMTHHDGPSARSRQSPPQGAVPQLATTRAL